MIDTAVRPEIELDQDHVYRVRGVVYPSVTQILSLSGLADFSSIPEEMREFALTRGQAVHAAIQYFMEGDLDESTLDPQVAPRIVALNLFLRHSGFEIEPGMVEQKVFNERYGFCGKYDACGKLPALNGKKALADWKNCAAGMSGTRYQLAAYLLCIPRIYHRAAVTLKANATFSVETYSPLSLQQDQATFLDALSDLRKRGLV